MQIANLKYPIGLQDFYEIRQGGYVYIDKTEYIHKLVSTGKYFFLSRPRRFGKSMFISTIQAYFEGRRELFRGLAIDSYPEEWDSYPVLRFDLVGFRFSENDSLKTFLTGRMLYYAEKFGLDIPIADIGSMFKALIERIHTSTGHKVVILVDEYDKPLLDNMDDRRLQEDFRSDLKSFYGNLKSMDAHIKFALLTGVTKLGKLSIFSDLNNLHDISLQKDYAEICGITETELRRYLSDGVGYLAEELGITAEEAFEELRVNYDGYHFAPEGKDIYNPFSILNALSSRFIGDYWYETGTPTFLVKMVKKSGIELSDINRTNVKLSSLDSVTFEPQNMEALMYQSGYLTIKEYNKRFQTVTLDYPNREVEEGFLNQLASTYTLNRHGRSDFAIDRFVTEVESGNIESFMTRLQSLFADYQYDQMDLGNLELHYRNVIYLVMKLMGLYTNAEMRTASGRIDLRVVTDCFVYIFEFKIDSTAEKALGQINEKDYALPYHSGSRRVFKIGANFSNKARSLDSWIIEEDLVSKCSNLGSIS